MWGGNSEKRKKVVVRGFWVSGTFLGKCTWHGFEKWCQAPAGSCMKTFKAYTYKQSIIIYVFSTVVAGLATFWSICGADIAKKLNIPVTSLRLRKPPALQVVM
jgi:hypothetical protein